MKRTFNYTGRKEIPKGHITVRLQEAAGAKPSQFSVQFGDLAKLGLPANASVFVEAYVPGGSVMRFPFGTVGQLRSPASTSLDEMDVGGRILFRVKVVDPAAPTGRLLGTLAEVAPRDESDSDGRKPLLPLRHADIGEELWILRFLAADGPELHVSNRVPGLADRIKSDPILQGLVLPQALRTIVHRLYEDDGDATWTAEWREMAESVVSEPVDWSLDPVNDHEEVAEAVERIVRKFVDGRQYATRSAALGDSQHD